MENIRAADNVSSNAKSCLCWFISGEKKDNLPQVKKKMYSAGREVDYQKWQPKLEKHTCYLTGKETEMPSDSKFPS